ncbi:P protein-like [Drosophila tropicalis]|uniref:P protein-like n=1 Tax=Drosophila tropicalis TaxID=46794 RepID=UPI0035ABE6AE
MFPGYDHDDGLTEEQGKGRDTWDLICTGVKISILLIIWLFFTVVLIIKKPQVLEEFLVSVEPNKLYANDITSPSKAIEVKLRGRIDIDIMHDPSNATKNSSSLIVWLQHVDVVSMETSWQSELWQVYLLETVTKEMTLAKYLFQVPQMETKVQKGLQLAIATTSMHAESMIIVVNSAPINKNLGVICAIILILFLYTLVIWDILDRTLAALITTSAAIAVLGLLDARPSLRTIMSWIDIDTLMLLFGMMIMVAIFAETGAFDYIAVMSYRCSKGHAGRMMFFLCLFSAFLSAFLDNVTMVLLMVPLTIRLCEVMSLRPTSSLILIAIFTNIGGTLTPVGDPPNVILATNEFVIHHGIDFFNFTLHMLPGVLLGLIVSLILLYVMLHQKILMAKSPNQLSTGELDERMSADIRRRTEELTLRYSNRRNSRFFRPVPNFEETLAELEIRYKIRNKPLLIKCCIAIGFAIVLFFTNAVPFMKGARLPWIAVLADLLLLILANFKDMQVLLLKVEWSTLLFFASLFILTEILVVLGLIEWICAQTVSVILSVSEKYQLTVAITLVLWISAITSAFVDNIPITTMMLKLAIELDNDKSLHLPFPPLVWALAFGACFGGNGTLIGASANVVSAGLASQHGYKITFMEFLIIGFPLMISTVLVVWIYLLIAHSVFSWH